MQGCYVIEVQFDGKWGIMVRCVNVSGEGNLTPCTLEESNALLDQYRGKYSWPLRIGGIVPMED